MKYLALGDSYTAGTGASSSAHGWPAIVAARLTQETGSKVKITNPAVGGFTTLDLIAKELSQVRRIKPDLITILIGVNDLVQGRGPNDYRASLVKIYDEVAAQKAPDGRVFAISLPNWSVVPAVRQFGDPEEIRDLTDLFNDIAREEAETRGFKWIDITAASLSGLGSPGWIASDGLHPGDNQYAAWAEVIFYGMRFPSPASAAEGQGEGRQRTKPLPSPASAGEGQGEGHERTKR